MQISFASPSGALVALAVIIPLGALFVIEARGRRVRRTLGLRSAAGRSWLVHGAAIALIAALAAIAAAQPLASVRERQLVRGDAEIYLVLDTSRSMLAARAPRAETRFERARAAASRLRSAFPDVPVGIASLTDRLLPHLFPTTDEQAFAATLRRAVGVDRPPPRVRRRRASAFAPLADAAIWNFFSEIVTHRVLVVFTDGEGQSVDPDDLRRALQGQPRLQFFFVHVWNEDERVFDGTEPEPEYLPDPGSREQLERVARAVGGEVFGEDDVSAVESALRGRIGSGRRAAEAVFRRPRPLAPYALAAAFLPLGFLLWRRNRP